MLDGHTKSGYQEFGNILIPSLDGSSPCLEVHSSAGNLLLIRGNQMVKLQPILARILPSQTPDPRCSWAMLYCQHLLSCYFWPFYRTSPPPLHVTTKSDWTQTDPFARALIHAMGMEIHGQPGAALFPASCDSYPPYFSSACNLLCPPPCLTSQQPSEAPFSHWEGERKWLQESESLCQGWFFLILHTTYRKSPSLKRAVAVWWSYDDLLPTDIWVYYRSTLGHKCKNKSR